MPDRLEDLLVGPAGLPCLLVQMKGRVAVGFQGRLQVLEQRGLLGIAGGEAARTRDLVEPEPGAAGRPRVLGDAVGVTAMLGHRKRDPLAGGCRQDAGAELGTHPRVGAENRRRAGQHSDELGHGATACLNALQDRRALVWRGELVVDMESADFCLYGQFWSCFPAQRSLPALNEEAAEATF